MARFMTEREAVIVAARAIVNKTAEDFEDMKGSNSLGIPVEFMALHYAVEALTQAEAAG